MASVTFTHDGQHIGGKARRIPGAAAVRGAAAVLCLAIAGTMAFSGLATAISSSFSVTADPTRPVSLVPASKPMMLAIHQAMDLESHGIFGDQAEGAWQKAAEECRHYSLQHIATTQGHPVQLWMLEIEEGRAQQIAAILEELLPGRRDALLAGNGGEPVTWAMVAGTARQAIREWALKLSSLHDEAIANAATIRRYRDIVNYDYWKAVCEVEGTKLALEAREAIWHADRDVELGRLQEAKAEYEAGITAMRHVLEAAPVLEQSQTTADELREIVGRYHRVLSALHEGVPQDFILAEVAEVGAWPLVGGL